MSRKTKQMFSTKAMVTTILAFAILCLAGVGYLWQKTRIYALGRQIKALETQVDRLQVGNQALERAYAAMCSPRELDARVRKLNLGLAAPQPDQIVRMSEPISPNERPQVVSAEPRDFNN